MGNPSLRLSEVLFLTPVPRFRLTKWGFVVLLDFSLSVKAATLIFISGCDSAISTSTKGKSGFIYSLVKS